MSSNVHIGTHQVYVPAGALALLGSALQAKDVDVVDITKPYDRSGDKTIAPHTAIRMTLV